MAVYLNVLPCTKPSMIINLKYCNQITVINRAWFNWQWHHKMTIRTSSSYYYLPSPNLGLTPPGTYKPNARGSDACRRRSSSLWTTTLDRYTRGGGSLNVGQHNVRASAEDNTGQNTKDAHPIPEQKFKFLTPPGIEPGPPGWKAGRLPTTPRRRITLYNKFELFICSLNTIMWFHSPWI